MGGVTFMYGTQDQRLRSNAEREQLVELFSYAVGIFDFEPDPDLRKFVQVRGAVQLYGYFVQEMRRNLKRLKEMRMDPKVNPVDLHQKIEEGVDGIESLTKLMVKVITTLRG